jgi:hypothetical protein
VLDALLLTIMATLAQGLEGTSPELLDVAVMGLDMVTHEQRGIAFDSTTLRALTGVEIAPEDLQSQLQPARRLVQGTAWIIPTTAAISCPLLLGRSWNGQRRPNGTEPGLDETDLRHVQINKKPLTPRRWRLLNVISVCERTSLSMHDAGLEPLAVAMWCDGGTCSEHNSPDAELSTDLPKASSVGRASFKFSCRPHRRQTYSPPQGSLRGIVAPLYLLEDLTLVSHTFYVRNMWTSGAIQRPP